MLSIDIPRFFYLDKKAVKSSAEVDYEKRMKENVIFVTFKQILDAKAIAELFNVYGDINVTLYSILILYRLSKALIYNASLNSHLLIRICSVSIPKYKTLSKRPNKTSKITKGVFSAQSKHLIMQIDSTVKRMLLNLSTKQIDCLVYMNLNSYMCMRVL